MEKLHLFIVHRIVRCERIKMFKILQRIAIKLQLSNEIKKRIRRSSSEALN